MIKNHLIALVTIVGILGICASIGARCFEREVLPVPSDEMTDHLDEEALASEPRMLGMRGPDHRMPDVEKIRARMESVHESPVEDMDSDLDMEGPEEL